MPLIESFLSIGIEKNIYYSDWMNSNACCCYPCWSCTFRACDEQIKMFGFGLFNLETGFFVLWHSQTNWIWGNTGTQFHFPIVTWG